MMRRGVIGGLAALALPAKAMARPDFGAVISLTAAKRLVSQGELAEIWLFPAELGGPKDPRNRSFIAAAAAQARRLAIGTLRKAAEQDLIDQLGVDADYKGHSIVPSRIRMTGTHSRGGPPLVMLVEIW